jgi:hypothetical protein
VEQTREQVSRYLVGRPEVVNQALGRVDCSDCRPEVTRCSFQSSN